MRAPRRGNSSSARGRATLPGRSGTPGKRRGTTLPALPPAGREEVCRAGDFWMHRTPGRCPGLMMNCPFGACHVPNVSTPRSERIGDHFGTYPHHVPNVSVTTSERIHTTFRTYPHHFRKKPRRSKTPPPGRTRVCITSMYKKKPGTRGRIPHKHPAKFSCSFYGRTLYVRPPF